MFSTPEPKKMSPLLIGWLTAGVVSLVVGVLGVAATLRSTNSTAAIGFFVLPVPMTLAAIPAFICGWSLGNLRAWKQIDSTSKRVRTIIGSLLAFFLIGYAAHFFYQGFALMKKTKEVQSMQAAQLEEVLNDPRWGRNKFVLGIVAQNPNASADILHRIVQLNLPEFHEPMGSIFPVMGKNGKGLSLMRLALRHPNIAAEDIESLNSSPNEMVRGDAAQGGTSEEALRRLATQGRFSTEMGLALNPNTPHDLMAQLAQNQSEYVRSNLASNPSAPPEILDQLSRDSSWLVRRSVAGNLMTSNQVIEALLNDPHSEVSKTAQYQIQARTKKVELPQ